MLIYNKIHDPYHTLLRLLKILNSFKNDSIIEYDRLRIYDFLLANPQEINEIRLVKKGKSEFKKNQNPYNKYDRNLLFYNLERIQKTAIEHLLKHQILTKVLYDDGYIINKAMISNELLEAISETKSISNKALDFIIHNLNDIDLYRENGLKDRTNLLGYKYDPRN